MHRFLLLIALLFLLYKIHAQTGSNPEPIFSVTKIHKSLDYYTTQAALWEKEVQKDNKNADAWFYFFTAARMANIFTPSEADRPYDMNKIAESIQTNIPNTFEAHYLTFWQNNPSDEAYEHLQKAYEIAPERYETYHDMITKAEFERDKKAMKKFSELWYHHEYYSPGITNWNYNVFMSVEPNAILITQGDNDTYPLWLLQYVKNFRKDVAVLNISLLLREKYRNAILKENGIPEFNKNIEDFGSSSAFFKAVTEHIINNIQRPVYFGLSLPKALRNNFEEHLYLTGLTYKYSEKDFDNKAVIRNNFENKFLIDYLKFSFQEDFSETVVHFMNQQYIPCLTVLHEHYRLSGEVQKAEEIEQMLMKIARESDREEEIAHYLEKTKEQ